jgi:hypothetical protein
MVATDSAQETSAFGVNILLDGLEARLDRKERMRR